MNTKIFFPVCLAILLLGTSVFAQKYIGSDRLMRMRDSLDRLLVVSPTSSVILVRAGEFELYSFNSVLNNERFTDKMGNNANFYGRHLLFNSLFQINTGLSKNRRINLGADMIYRAYRYEQTGTNSMFDVFDEYSKNTQGLAYAGPRLRLQPFRKVKNFNYQTYVWFPLAEKEKRATLGANRINWGNSLFYYRYFGGKVGIFVQAAATLGFPSGDASEQEKTELQVPVSLTLSYVLLRKNIFFISGIYGRSNKDISKAFQGADSDFGQLGGGYQRIFTRRFFMNVSYNATVFARNSESWTNLTFGVYYVL